MLAGGAGFVATTILARRLRSRRLLGCRCGHSASTPASPLNPNHFAKIPVSPLPPRVLRCDREGSLQCLPNVVSVLLAKMALNRAAPKPPRAKRALHATA